MSDLVDTAARRWLDAALLLSCAGRAPRDALSWLGVTWTGAAAGAYERWSGTFELASRRAAEALRDAARELRERRLDAHRADSACREMRAVPLPGDRPPQPPPRPPDSPADTASDPPDEERAAPAPSTARPGTVGDWIDQARQILLRHGYRPEQLDPDDIATIIKHESSGNPNAVNNWDSNAARGTPSMGLMQTIRPTFERYHLPGHDDILNPVDNIIAGVRYAVDRYGSVSRVPGVLSLAAGGDYRGY